MLYISSFVTVDILGTNPALSGAQEQCVPVVCNRFVV